jgi:HSP20 family protein
MAERRTEVVPREEQRLSRREREDFGNPFRMLERFADEMDRIFDDFGFGRAVPSSRLSRGAMRPWSRAGGEQWTAWTPDIEMFHRNDQLVLRADLPGLTKDDVKVDVTDDAITIQGERKQEHQEEQEGVYRSERTYGSFLRSIPLPEGVIADQAKATFKDGVLEITMPAPPEQVRRGRRVEITEGSSTKK